MSDFDLSIVTIYLLLSSLYPSFVEVGMGPLISLAGLVLAQQREFVRQIDSDSKSSARQLAMIRITIHPVRRTTRGRPVSFQIPLVSALLSKSMMLPGLV
jgi:hypothetical protein